MSSTSQATGSGKPKPVCLSIRYRWASWSSSLVMHDPHFPQLVGQNIRQASTPTARVCSFSFCFHSEVLHCADLREPVRAVHLHRSKAAPHLLGASVSHEQRFDTGYAHACKGPERSVAMRARSLCVSGCQASSAASASMLDRTPSHCRLRTAYLQMTCAQAGVHSLRNH